MAWSAKFGLAHCPEGSSRLESLEEAFEIGLPGASSAGYSY